MAEGNFQFINEEIRKLKEKEADKQSPESFSFKKCWGPGNFEIRKSVVVVLLVGIFLLVLFVVFLATTLSNDSSNPTIYTQNGYKLDATTSDFGLYGYSTQNLQVSTLARDGLRVGPGYTVKFGQVLDGLQRDVCAYPPETIYSSWGVVQVDQNSSAWNPRQQSQLFLPGDDSILVPFTANPAEVLEISRAPDFNSLMQFNGKLYMGVHHEAPRPSEVSFLEINRSNDGKFSVVSTRRVNFSAYNGTWNSCAGSMTPWGTHLGSQEYDPDARIVVECDTFECMADFKEFDTQNIQNFMRYYGFYYGDTQCYQDQKPLTVSDAKQYFNPYMYGHIPEIGVDGEGNPTVQLWFTLGRFSHEAAIVLPDNKTVYLTDDGTNTGFYKFVADQPNDLSSGCIFGAKAIQNTDNTFNFTWIQLACGSNDEIEQMVRGGVQFDDIFSFTQADDSGNSPICPTGFTSTNVGHDHRLECLQLKPQQQKTAAFLETRRMLAIMGGTTEFSKTEGITFDGMRNRVYVGISEVRYGMEDNMRKGESKSKYDIGGPNDIKLQYNPCGCVYASDLDDTYTATNLYPLICGQLLNPQDPEQGCQLNKIAGPDNVAMAGPDGILISEDTDMHVNNFLWLYDLNTTVLTRVASCMYGSEVTGPYYHPNVQGSSYIFFVCQHPYEESNRDKVMEAGATGLAGWLNYIGPLPVLAENEVLFCDNVQAPTGEERHQVKATSTCYTGKRVSQ